MGEWHRNKKRNQEIRNLRSQGFSIREISDRLQCSKSTVSLHCKGIKYQISDDAAEVRAEARRRNNLGSKNHWDKKKEEIRSEARSKWDKIKNDPQMMGFLGLYWGEGCKTHSHVGIANTDPYLLRASLDILRTLTDKNIIATVKYYYDHDKNDLLKFWKKTLPSAEIRMEENKDKRSGKGKTRCKYGMCYLRFSDWRVFHSILTWIECWKKEIRV